MTSGVGEYPSPKGQPGDHARVGLRLRGRRGGGQFQVLDSEVVEPGRDQRLLLRSEVGEGELLALPECRLDDVERCDGHGHLREIQKPSSIGTRGSLSRYHPTSPSPCEDDLLESAARSPEDSGLITEATRLSLLERSLFGPAAPRPFSAVPWTLPLSCRRFSVVPASAYSPSSTPLNMNLLGQTIAVPRGACQATAA